MTKIAMIGYGEAGRAVAEGWRSERLAASLSSYDLKAGQAEHRDSFAAAWQAAGVVGHDRLEDALRGQTAVFCLVTAGEAVAAAEAARPHLEPGTLWFDGNSCSPGTKRRAATAISSAGGRYVDLAIMSPIRPKRHQTPMLLSGPFVDDALEVLSSLRMNAVAAGTAIGDASSIKMLRSVMIKGIEALTAECLLAARRAGVEDAVLASLQRSDPGFDWTKRSAYNLERMRHHGARRAIEMLEVAATLRELGLPDRLATATSQWQSQLAGVEGPDEDLGSQLDAILEAMG